MSDDVVAELDHWLRGSVQTEPHLILRRARDEIERLRKLTDGDWVWKQITDTRNEALEEAARVCEGGYTTGSTRSTLKAIAAAIRALKDTAP